MKKSLFISLIIFACFLFWGCPEPIENYPFWEKEYFKDLTLSVNLQLDEGEYDYAVKKNQQITLKLSGKVDPSEYGDLAVLLTVYKKTSNYDYDAYSNYIVSNSEELNLKKNNDMCTFLIPLNKKSLNQIDKEIQFSFSEAGRYRVNVYVDSAPRGYTEDDIACFDVNHGYLEDSFFFVVKGEINKDEE